MRWKQFFTPAKSIHATEAKTFMAERTQDEFNLIDVRQPKEYKASHIPSAKLIPISEPDKRLDAGRNWGQEPLGSHLNC